MSLPGMILEKEYLHPSAQESLLRTIDAQPWRHYLQRRTQHYGYRYDYRARTVTPDLYLGPLPQWIQGIAADLQKQGWFPNVPDQVIVNEYQPGQGISMHMDRECFGPVVATLSLGDEYPMQFKPLRGTPGTFFEMPLPQGSILILSGTARNGWMHGIAKQSLDGSRQRKRRVSVTFRTVGQGAR